jgi:glycosyltransferase involved in cell wall biosynthesis
MSLSIITINLNNFEGLKKTFQSIYPLSVNLKTKIEHIIIDGCSVDGSVEFLNSNLSFGYKLVIEKDFGIFDAMNKGLAHANGEYVIFMNSGDQFCDGILTQKFLDNLENVDLLYGNIVTEKEGLKTNQIQTNQLDFFYMLGKTVCHQSVFMKTSFCKKYKFLVSHDYSLMGDWIQLFSILRHEKITINYVNDFVCVYNVEGESEKQKDLRFFQRNQFLKTIYSDWELIELEKISRLRNRKYYDFIIQSLDKFRYNIILKCIAKLQWN